MENNEKKTAIIIGAGPAGLSAAYNLIKNTDIKPVILEKGDVVGGISRTVFYDGSGTDIGPHRLFTKNNDVLNMWLELLPLQGVPPIDDKILGRNTTVSQGGPDPDEVDRVMLKRIRVSRIYYLRKFFDYPLKLKPATFINMGLKRTFLAGMSYLKSCFHKVNEVTLEDFMVNRFGRVLYEMFFEKYTQKVWGLHPSEISKEWGEQRIKGLSLWKAVISALSSMLKINHNTETSLIEEYYYPKYGCSQLWQSMADYITANGGEIHFGCEVKSFDVQNGNISGVKVINSDNNEQIFLSDIVISSMPVKDLIEGLKDVPDEIRDISENLPYREYMLASYCCKNVNLPNNTNIPTINNIAPDSWIYLQEEDMTAGRLHIMNNCSPYVIDDFRKHVMMNLEYFCSENDDMWNMSDDDFLNFGYEELHKLGILKTKEDILHQKRVKVVKAYPAYFGSYPKFDEVKSYLNSIENLYCIGRNGQHKYNNMDHSMLSGIEVVNVIKNNLDKQLVWDVNTEQEYHEVKK